MGPVDVDRPEWAQRYAVGDEIAVDVPWREGVKRLEIVGFSSLEEHYGRPIVLSDEELAEHGLRGQVAITQAYHVPPEEVSDRA